MTFAALSRPTSRLAILGTSVFVGSALLISLPQVALAATPPLLSGSTLTVSGDVGTGSTSVNVGASVGGLVGTTVNVSAKTPVVASAPVVATPLAPPVTSAPVVSGSVAASAGTTATTTAATTTAGTGTVGTSTSGAASVSASTSSHAGVSVASTASLTSAGATNPGTTTTGTAALAVSALTGTNLATGAVRLSLGALLGGGTVSLGAGGGLTVGSGGQLTLQGSGLEPGSTVTVKAGSGSNALFKTIVDSKGRISRAFSIPGTLSSGPNAITVSATSALGRPASVRKVVTITGDAVLDAQPTLTLADWAWQPALLGLSAAAAWLLLHRRRHGAHIWRPAHLV